MRKIRKYNTKNMGDTQQGFNPPPIPSPHELNLSDCKEDILETQDREEKSLLPRNNWFGGIFSPLFIC